MAFDLEKLLRPHISKIKPYSSARDEYSGKAGIFLDANENPFGSMADGKFNRYPDPYQLDIKQKLAVVKGVEANQIFLGNGSDEAIDLLMRAFCRPGIDNIILLPPTYGMYEVSAGINDIAIQKVNLTPDYQLRPDAILEAVNENTKIIFICSPNNPSGNKVKRSDIHQILNNFQGLVVVDEAYIDFSDEPSFTTELANYPNLLVMQTFSKAWGLASLRIGMAFASVEIIKILNLIKPPYNISGLTQEKVLEALDNASAIQRIVKDTLAERAFLKTELEKFPFVSTIYPSHANFLLIKTEGARKIYEYLIEQTIIIRDRSKVVLCEDCLRISVGTRTENEALLKALVQYKP
ncbi:histidinol phosphate aminotransferase apoenzyme [Belliella baltica DSM 15883]|uniref:Histidinol-phosphate aminotransferase n=1 Tax=Belliella baltica (strain DSM 15883 / CIP 108006 / LMG 21964 / BA134) TaxID=866536 RepID=I3Z6C0_BELBD|nr:histidinol-phosphate transaminase [Belliella baltica]AFL84788.1 histidinol phosphate aminotransferase apoenzyme [Belliella baltica DSM 15883]